MGQHANQLAWAEFERKQREQQDAYFEAEPEPSEDELAAVADDAYWQRIDAEASGVRVGEWR